jgi:hypothetical protein
VSDGFFMEFLDAPETTINTNHPRFSGEHFRLPKWFKRNGVNAVLLEAFWRALEQADPELAAAMIYLEDAVGRHLDAHGLLYGLQRLVGETDDLYRQRIIAELLNPRSTTKAIIDTITAALPGVQVSVTTPYEKARAEGVYFIDGTWRLDGSVTFKEPTSPEASKRAVFYVDIEGPDPDLTRARAVIERVRAAGYIPTVRFSFSFSVEYQPTLEVTVQRREVFYFNGARTLNGTWLFGLNNVGPQTTVD